MVTDLEILRKTSKLRTELGPDGVRFLEHSLKSIGRLLPHTEFAPWKEGPAPGTKAHRSSARWTSPAHRGITLSVLVKGSSRMLTGTVTRRKVWRASIDVPMTLDQRELGICRLVLERISLILRGDANGEGAATSLRAISGSFDEEILSDHLRQHHSLSIEMSSFLRAIHQISETTYENSALAFGCVISKKGKGGKGIDGPEEFLGALVRSKKYRALSDGYRTAYEVSAKGKLLRFRSLEPASLGGKHYSPEWTEWLAAAASDGRLAVCLTRNGDILLFAGSNMTFAYRYGQWKFWNHSHLINLLKALARVQKVPAKIIGSVVSSVYRAALDVSFRRSGALFLILKNQTHIDDVARAEDRIDHHNRAGVDAALDQAAVAGRKLQSLPRAIVAELAALDGAVVLSNMGKILAYGAVLRPKKQGKLKGTEGSREKAAIGASHYGLAVKVSSDGDISVFSGGREFLKI